LKMPDVGRVRLVWDLDLEYGDFKPNNSDIHASSEALISYGELFTSVGLHTQNHEYLYDP